MVHPSVASAYGPLGLRCEYAENPIGLEEPLPRFSWQVNEPERPRGVVQQAYQIQVASSTRLLEWEQPDLWDSGKVESSQNLFVLYAGQPLTSGLRCHWRVRTWNRDGQPSPWSMIAFWEMGLLQSADWKAAWLLGPERSPEVEPGASPSPLFRKTFTVTGDIRRARVYVTARGLYELHINGKRTGEDCFTPGWTNYFKRIPYQTYDVTQQLQAGENVLAATLADGWYCGHLAWKKRYYGKEPSFLAQLVIEYADDRVETIVTDGSWKTSDVGPVRSSDMLMGEQYDARLADPRWMQAGFDDGAWAPPRVEVLDLQSGPKLVAALGPRVRKIERLAAKTMAQPVAGKYVFDLGQNFSGWVRLTLPGALPAGSMFTLRHAEMLNPDGTLYTTNLRGAKATDVYISDGQPIGWEPRFTYHGFRYVELTLQPAPGADAAALPAPEPAWITGIVAHSDTPPTGQFACSHELVNQLQHNIQWGQKSNFFEVPTDCPQRNERLGWTGDAQIFIRTAAFNMDVAGFFAKWLVDLEDSQMESGDYQTVAPDIDQLAGGPGWSDAGIICPWTLYQVYGDKRILERHFDSMQRYVDFLLTQDHRGPRQNFGDWLSHQAMTPPDLIAAAFSAHAIDLFSRIARVLGKKKDAVKYEASFKAARTAFQKRYVTPEGKVFGGTQTGYILALRFNLLADKTRAAAGQELAWDIRDGWTTGQSWARRKGHLSTGFLGVKDLNFALSENGNLDLAYQLLLTETFPSWLFPVKHGATTMWERWNSWTPEQGFGDAGMNSFNHYAYGAIGQWLYQVVAGLDLADAPDAGGYQRLLIRPQIDPQRRITWARAELATWHGQARSSWKLAGERLQVEVVIPANTRATVTLPCSVGVEGVLEGGKSVAQASGVIQPRVDNEQFVCGLESGHYVLELPVKG